MATKKQEAMFVILDKDACCFVDFDSMQNTDVEEVVFGKEVEALNAAKDALTKNSGFDDDEVLTVYKLVPVARVKHAKAVVERL